MEGDGIGEMSLPDIMSDNQQLSKAIRPDAEGCAMVGAGCSC
jgi:hypothetical protein